MDMEHFQTQRDSEADQLFDAVDTDKDGVISRKEWTQALNYFCIYYRGLKLFVMGRLLGMSKWRNR